MFGVKPDLTREGGSIPVTLTFQDCLGKNVLLLPMGRGIVTFEIGINLQGMTVRILLMRNWTFPITSQVFRLEVYILILGIKLLGAYLHEISAIKAE